MAKTYSKSGSPVNKVEKTERYYTVSYATYGENYTLAPAIRLKGCWLKTVGFDIGVKVTAKVIYGCLILIPSNYNKFIIQQQKKQIKKQLKKKNKKHVPVIKPIISVNIDDIVEKTERYYTVSYARYGQHYISAPLIRIRGCWLKAMGFDIGVKITVRVIYGCLILIPDNHNKSVIHQQRQEYKKQIAKIKSGITELFDAAQDTCK